MAEQDDEGYTSPSKDNNVLVSNQATVGGIGREQSPTTGSDSLTSARCRVAWENISRLPPSEQSRHLTWDDIKYPFPYRSSNYSKNDPNRINLESKVFISDEIKTSNAIVDKMWMLSFDTNAGHSQASRTVRDFIAAGLTPTYITMNQFIDHALHLMCGRESQSFSLKANPGTPAGSGGGDMLGRTELLFTNNANVIVHGLSPVTLKGFCVPFLECGSSYKRLSRIRGTDDLGACVRRNSIDCVQQYSKRNAVFQSFISFISSYLKMYETVIMLQKDSTKTMTQLLVLVRPLGCQLAVLEQIVEAHVDGNAVELLTALNDLLFSVENQAIVNVIKNLFISCASAYLRYIADWIFRGELGSGMEFHITKNPKTFDGRRFWTKQFIQKETIPEFLKESVENIFETGKALNLLITLQPLLQSVKTSEVLAASIGEKIKAELGFDNLKLLGDLWAYKLDCFCSENFNLMAEIQESIFEVIFDTSKILEIDVVAAEQRREDFHIKMEQQRLDAFQREKEKKQDLLQTLQHQIKLSKEHRIQKRNEELLEDKKIQDYLAQLDQQNAEGTPGFARNYFPRSATGLDICDGVSGTSKTAIPSSKSVPHSIVNIVSHCGDGSGKQLQCDKSTISPASARDIQSRDIKMGSKGTEIEVRFNPDKIITRNPEPYAFSPLSDFGKSIIPHRTVNVNANSKLLRKEANYDQFCLNEFLSRSISIPLMAQNKMVNTVLLHHIIKEKMLYHHLGMLNNFLCLQNGVFSHFLSQLLIDEVKKSSLCSPRDLYEKSYRVNSILGEALSIALDNELTDPLLKNINFKFDEDLKKISDQPSKASSKFQVLNHLRLTYTVEWPVNIILTDEMMNLYENIFAFLMKLIRAELLLKRMFCHLKFKSAKSRQLFQLNNFRFRMLHFVRAVRNYVNITVIHTAWNDLCSRLHELDSIEKIYLQLVAHVKSINSNCLLGQKGEKILKFILNHLLVVESFCSQLDTIIQKSPNGEIQWDKGAQLSKEEFHELTKKYEVSEEYAKLFTESVLKVSTRRAYNKVDNFLEHYNFNGFFHAS